MRIPVIPVVGALLAATASCPPTVGAQTKLTLAPSVAVSAISDDNVFSTQARSSDQLTLVSPGVQTRLETPRTTFVGAYSLDMLRAADLSALNDLDARRHAMFDAAFRQTSRLTLDLNGHYDRTDEAGDLNFGTGVLLPRTRATRWELGPSFSYRTSPLVTVSGQYVWVQESLEHALMTDEHVGRLVVARQLSTRLTISGGYVGRRFVNGDAFETSNAALAGATYQLRPFATLAVQAGPRVSSAKGLQPEIAASFKRRGPELVGYTLDAWRGESIILGVAGPVEVTSATGRFSVPVRPRVEVGAGGGVFDSNSLFQGRARVYHAEAVASWNPKSFYTIAASYGADFQHGDIRTSLLNDRDIVRHVFLVEFTVAPRVSRTIQPTGPLQAMARRTQGNQP